MKDFYSKKAIRNAFENDGIDSEEEGFMIGYLSA